MKSLREMEKQLDTLEAASDKGALYMTLDDGRHIKLVCGSQDEMLNVLTSSIKNEDFPFREYIKHAVAGVPSQGALVMTCRAIIESFEMNAAAKEGL